MGKKIGSGMNNPDHIFESLETIFWVKMLKVFDSDPGSGIFFLPWIRDGKNSDPGLGINMPDSQNCLVGRIVVAMAMLAVVMIPCVVSCGGCKFTDVAALLTVVVRRHFVVARVMAAVQKKCTYTGVVAVVMGDVAFVTVGFNVVAEIVAVNGYFKRR
jgi:hypothetical protein